MNRRINGRDGAGFGDSVTVVINGQIASVGTTRKGPDPNVWGHDQTLPVSRPERVPGKGPDFDQWGDEARNVRIHGG